MISLNTKHWLFTELENIGEVTTGNSAPQDKKYFEDGTIPFVRVFDLGLLRNSVYIKNTRDKLNEKVNKKMKLYPKGSVLFTKSGMSLLLNQRAILNTNMYVVSHIGVIVSKPEIKSEWVYYWLKTIDFKKYAHATTLPSLKISLVRKLKFPLPPINEQTRIVGKMEELFSDLDKAVEDLKKTQEQILIYKQAVLNKTYTRVWPKIELEKISEAVGGYAFKGKEFIEKGKYQVIRIGNVRPGKLRLEKSAVFINNIENSVIERYLLKKGDVIISLTGTRKKRDYGFTAIINKSNLLLNQRLAYLRINKKCLPEFLLYYTWTELFKDQFFDSETGNVGQGNVGMKSIRLTTVPLPSIQTQKQVVQEIESWFSVCDKLEETVKQSLNKIEYLRQSILKKAFEGRLVPQDPNDEPAEKLLERIKKEKAKIELQNEKSKKAREKK